MVSISFFRNASPDTQNDLLGSPHDRDMSDFELVFLRQHVYMRMRLDERNTWCLNYFSIFCSKVIHEKQLP